MTATLPRSGRPSNTSIRTTRKVISQRKANPNLTTRDLQTSLASSGTHACFHNKKKNSVNVAFMGGLLGRNLCSQKRTKLKTNLNAVAGPEMGSSCQTPFQPPSTGCILQRGVGKNPPKQMWETDSRYRDRLVEVIAAKGGAIPFLTEEIHIFLHPLRFCPLSIVK